MSNTDPQGLEGVGSWNNGGGYQTVYESSGGGCGCSSAGGGGSNNTHLQRNILLGGASVGAIGIVAANVIGFPEVEAAEGTAAVAGITFVSAGGLDGVTALEIMDGAAGEPVISSFLASKAGFAAGAVPGAILGAIVPTSCH